MPYGYRRAMVRDPYGNVYQIASASSDANGPHDPSFGSGLLLDHRSLLRVFTLSGPLRQLVDTADRPTRDRQFCSVG